MNIVDNNSLFSELKIKFTIIYEHFGSGINIWFIQYKNAYCIT